VYCIALFRETFKPYLHNFDIERKKKSIFSTKAFMTKEDKVDKKFFR
jgi:hypothetical protein